MKSAIFSFSVYANLLSARVYDSQVFMYSAEAWKQPAVRDPPAAVLLLGGFSSTPGTRCFYLQRVELHGHLGATRCDSKGGTVRTIPTLPTAACSCSKLWPYMWTGKRGCLWGAITVLVKWHRRHLLTEANSISVFRGSLRYKENVKMLVSSWISTHLTHVLIFISHLIFPHKTSMCGFYWPER